MYKADVEMIITILMEINKSLEGINKQLKSIDDSIVKMHMIGD